MKPVKLILVIIVLFSFSFSCGNNNRNNLIKIGSILPLTGDASNYGNKLKKGMDLAIKKINENSDNNKKIEIFYEDDKGSPNVSISAYNKLVSSNKINFIIGGMFSNIALALAPIVEKDSVILMSPTASAIELSNAGDHFFRIYPSDSYDGNFLASFCFNNLKVKDVSIVSLEAASTTEISKIFEDKFLYFGGNIEYKTSYKNKETNFRTIIQNLKLSKAQVVFIPGYIEDIANILKQSKELGLNKIFISISTVYDKKFLDITGNASENLIFSAPSFDVNNTDIETVKFIKIFREEYKEDADILAAYGYDVINISYKAISVAKNSSLNEIISNLYNIKDYPGITGKTTFDKNGDVDKTLKIMKVVNGKFEEYK